MMPKQVQPEWTEFQVGPPSNSEDWFQPDCKTFDHVYHVTHIDLAWQILVDGRITAGLVYDKSKLRTERILVTWLSPNDWTNNGGFRYGNVRFAFEWEQLARDMNYYLVESITSYRPTACRILATKNDYRGLLDEYDPTIGDGPWWYDAENDTHYWNGKYCLEMMLDEHLNIDDCVGVDFVDHHRHYCNVDPRNCPSRGLRLGPASTLFIAGVVAKEIELNALQDDILDSAHGLLRSDLAHKDIEYRGSIIHEDRAALPQVRAVLDSYSRLNEFSLQELAGQFESKEELLNSCTRAIEDTFCSDF